MHATQTKVPLGGLTNGRTRAFLITIDTEGDNVWAGRLPITTRNAKYLPRFQKLCEKQGLKPSRHFPNKRSIERKDREALFEREQYRVSSAIMAEYYQGLVA